MMSYQERIFFFRSIRFEVEGLSMGINPTQIGKSPYTTALQRHHEDESSKERPQGLARPAGRPIRLEKGSVVDLYV